MKIEIKAEPRSLQGTGASRRLRRESKVPGILYGAGKDAQPIQLDHKDLWFKLKMEAFHASILDMEVGTEKATQVLLRDYQMHPWKQIILHIDFQRVDETTRLHKKVPLHFANEEESVAVKTDKCLVNHVMTELEVECLASQLPEFITIDLAHLVKGQSIHARDLKLPEGIKFVRHGSQNPVIVSANPPRVEEEVVAAPVVVAPAAAPVKAKKTEKQNKK